MAGVSACIMSARVELLIDKSEIFTTNVSISLILFVLFVFPLIVGLVHLYYNVFAD